MTRLRYVHDDGGRAAAGFKGKAGDCGVRAIAIAAGLDYREVYDRINALGAAGRARRKTRRNAIRAKRGLPPVPCRSNARTGVWPDIMHAYLIDVLGWTWTPTMAIGSGCRVHMRADELPKGRLVVRIAGHYAAVVDGVLRDTFDSSKAGEACVYGYWAK